MSGLIQMLQMYLSHQFVIYALVVGTLIALCSAMIGVTLVLKRFSFIGDGLSHVAFGAMCVATVMDLTGHMIITMPVTVISAVLLLRAGGRTKVKGDAQLAMISVVSLALGYLIMNLASTSSNLSGDVCSTLFGSTSILTLTSGDALLCGILSVCVVIAFIIFYNKIFAVTFDEDFARATGVRADAYNLAVAVIIAVIIVLGMSLVGSLLISALIIFPALAAMRIYKTFLSVTVCSVIISVICAVLGMLISICGGTPVGATVVAVDLVCYLGFCLVSKVRG